MKTNTLRNFINPFADEITDVLVIMEEVERISASFSFADEDGEPCDFSEAKMMICGFSEWYYDINLDLSEQAQYKEDGSVLHVEKHGVSLRFLTTINLAKYITE